MSILIGKYEFDGPYNSATQLEEKEGLYAVLHCQNEECELIHVAEADNIRERLELVQSEYKPTAGTVLLAACYTPRSLRRERRTMVEDIRREFDEQDDHECTNQTSAQTAS